MRWLRGPHMNTGGCISNSTGEWLSKHLALMSIGTLRQNLYVDIHIGTSAWVCMYTMWRTTLGSFLGLSLLKWSPSLAWNSESRLGRLPQPQESCLLTALYWIISAYTSFLKCWFWGLNFGPSCLHSFTLSPHSLSAGACLSLLLQPDYKQGNLHCVISSAPGSCLQISNQWEIFCERSASWEVGMHSWIYLFWRGVCPVYSRGLI